MTSRKAEKTNADSQLRLDQRRLADTYARGAYPDLLSMLREWLVQRGHGSLRSLNRAQTEALTNDLEAFVFYLTRPDVRFRLAESVALMAQQPVLTSIISMSDYGTSDPWVSRLKRKGRVSVPLMLLSHVRNVDAPDRKSFFDFHPLLASEWYGQYFIGVPGFANARVQQHLREHLQFWDERAEPRIAISNGYMRSTYIDPELDRLHKQRFNALARKAMAAVPVRNRPERSRIGVVTGRWSPINPTYKNRFPLFEALSEHYHLTLIHVGTPRDDLDTRIFSRVHRIWFERGLPKSDFLFDNDLGMLFFPDVGMSEESRFLSNIRFAPVQVTTNSHPVSTFGSEIDYFLTGAASEEPPEQARRHYQEQLVLIPGIGTLPVMPAYVPEYRPMTEPLRIACAWGVLKYNNALLLTLKRIAESVRTPVVFRFLSTMSPKSNYHVPFQRDLESILGIERVEFYAGQPHERYMDRLAECALALDSFPFGGNTSIVDCMALGVPIISRKGWQFYNLAGPVLLERFGLGELVTDSEPGYVELAKRLIDDGPYRTEVQKRIQTVDIKERLCETTDADAFLRAIADLLVRKPDDERTPLIYS
jgi:hypothetical protein